MSRPLRLAAFLLAVPLSLTTQAVSLGEAAAWAVKEKPVATHVCTSVPGCQRVATVDVDGDGRADEVGIVARDLAHSGTITVRVRTASGHTLATTGRHVYWFSKPYVGAAALDGASGAEIVVGDSMGANYEQFRVITYRAGKLVTEKEPPKAPAGAGMSRATARWGIDGSYSFNSGVFRTVSSDHVVALTLKTLERNASGHGHSGHVTSYRWHGGRWVEQSTATVRSESDRRAFASGGWHVRGLPRFS